METLRNLFNYLLGRNRTLAQLTADFYNLVDKLDDVVQTNNRLCEECDARVEALEAEREAMLAQIEAEIDAVGDEHLNCVLEAAKAESIRNNIRKNILGEA